MLVGEYLGGCHDTGLEPVILGEQCAEECHECLTGAHIALQKSVHLLSALHVFVYLAHHTFLRGGEGEGQEMVVERVERLSYLIDTEALGVSFSLLDLPEYLQLDIEELLELKPLACALHESEVFREMYIDEALLEVEQMVLFEQSVSQGLLYALFAQYLHHRVHYLRHRFGVERAVLHLLGGVVVWFESSSLAEVHLVEQLHLGVHDVPVVVEIVGFAEAEVAHTFLQLEVLQSVEPDEVHLVGAIGETCYESLVLTHAYCLDADYLADDLHIGLLVVDLAYLIEAAAVDILIREQIEQVARSAYVELFAQHVGSSRSYAREELYVGEIEVQGVCLLFECLIDDVV